MLAAHGPPLIFALFAWWFSTGAVLWLDRQARGSANFNMLAASVIGAAALAGVARSATDTTALGAYAAFSCALAIWGWHELSFLSGAVSGPRTEPCPAGAAGWVRFRLAAATLIYHEIALALTGIALVALTWGQPNQTAVWCYGVLFIMRISAKLNLFLGVPNFTDDFLPARLAYLKSYFRRRAFNALFPVSVIVGMGIAGASAAGALAAQAGGAAQVGLTLTFALVSLALLEHVFMIAPFRDSVLWRWAGALAANKHAHDPGRMP